MFADAFARFEDFELPECLRNYVSCINSGERVAPEAVKGRKASEEREYTILQCIRAGLHCGLTAHQRENHQEVRSVLNAVKTAADRCMQSGAISSNEGFSYELIKRVYKSEKAWLQKDKEKRGFAPKPSGLIAQSVAE